MECSEGSRHSVMVSAIFSGVMQVVIKGVLFWRYSDVNDL
jgi:hypothetical protein